MGNPYHDAKGRFTTGGSGGGSGAGSGAGGSLDSKIGKESDPSKANDLVEGAWKSGKPVLKGQWESQRTYAGGTSHTFKASGHSENRGTSPLGLGESNQVKFRVNQIDHNTHIVSVSISSQRTNMRNGQTESARRIIHAKKVYGGNSRFSDSVEKEVNSVKSKASKVFGIKPGSIEFAGQFSSNGSGGYTNAELLKAAGG